jgi:hypothetical protein
MGGLGGVAGVIVTRTVTQKGLDELAEKFRLVESELDVRSIDK